MRSWARPRLDRRAVSRAGVDAPPFPSCDGSRTEDDLIHCLQSRYLADQVFCRIVHPPRLVPHGLALLEMPAHEDREEGIYLVQAGSGGFRVVSLVRRTRYDPYARIDVDVTVADERSAGPVPLLWVETSITTSSVVPDVEDRPLLELRRHVVLTLCVRRDPLRCPVTEVTLRGGEIDNADPGVGDDASLEELERLLPGRTATEARVTLGRDGVVTVDAGGATGSDAREGRFDLNERGAAAPPP